MLCSANSILMDGIHYIKQLESCRICGYLKLFSLQISTLSDFSRKDEKTVLALFPALYLRRLILMLRMYPIISYGRKHSFFSTKPLWFLSWCSLVRRCQFKCWLAVSIFKVSSQSFILTEIWTTYWYDLNRIPLYSKLK